MEMPKLVDLAKEVAQILLKANMVRVLELIMPIIGPRIRIATR